MSKRPSDIVFSWLFAAQVCLVNSGGSGAAAGGVLASREPQCFVSRKLFEGAGVEGSESVPASYMGVGDM
ncbi:hypothetical protein E2C01_093139 [Portunus trituberculatus]|uniref:Secreted protein n=1 Tax=Portunus trituberculatus TaxID=210409 RepID=A0A5B7JZR3_PORTR|nr:hypothetical protein [Portunus trituberculatus]